MNTRAVWGSLWAWPCLDMLNINLVPENLRKKHSKAINPLAGMNIPMELMVGLVGGLFCLLIFVHLGLWFVTSQKLAEKKKLDGQMEGLLAHKRQTDAIIKELRVLQGKKSAIEKMMSAPKILWAPKFNDISDSMPRGVWLTKISLEEGKFTINGSAVSKGSDEMMGVVELASRLKDKKEFIKNLKSMEVGPIQRRKIESVEIADFSIMAKFQ